MKSNLWKQRREQDIRLVAVRKEIKKKKKMGQKKTSPKEDREPAPRKNKKPSIKKIQVMVTYG